MNIIVSEKQYASLLLTEQVNEVKINYLSFVPDTKYQKNYVYINGVSESDVKLLNTLKEQGSTTPIIFHNPQTKENIPFNLKNIFFTKNGKPFIFKNIYDQILPILETSPIKLDVNFLKKYESRFPEFITKILFELYPNNLGYNSYIDTEGNCNSDKGLIDIEGTNLPNQRWSILNFFDTNPMVIKKLIEWYYSTNPDIISIKDFGNWIKTNKEDLFKGEKLKVLVNLNMTSYLNGMKSEDVATKQLVSKYNVPNENIKQFCAGSSHDRKDGKDLEIVLSNGQSKFAQVKPLSNYTINDEYIIVRTYQMKNYQRKPIDYIIFSNNKDILVFENKNYVIESGNDFVKFKKSSLVDEIK